MQMPAPNPQQAEMQNGSRIVRTHRTTSLDGPRRPLHSLHAVALAAAHASPWSGSRRKRWFDCATAGLVLVLLFPFLLLIVLVVRLTSPGPAVFRQKRVGRRGEEFTILKFRTMHCAAAGSLRSAHKDRRLTPPGRWLRKYKLDELPQLINVVRGDMSLVGPRPKLHAHHTVNTPFRPGITGAATLAFAAEEHLLRNVHHDDLENTHARLISPRKTELDLRYMARATFRSDFQLILKTLLRADRYTEMEQLTGKPPHARPQAVHSAGSAPVYPELLHGPSQSHSLESISL